MSNEKRSKPLVIIESPWRGAKNISIAKEYLRACIRDSLFRGEVPWASHAMLCWTEALLDEEVEQREEGIQINFQMIERADLIAFYVDKGLSKGMERAWLVAGYAKIPCVKRTLNWADTIV